MSKQLNPKGVEYLNFRSTGKMSPLRDCYPEGVKFDYLQVQPGGNLFTGRGNPEGVEFE